jgi:hypothetical protein
MNYGDAIRFPFRGPKPWKNIALMALCHLIPIIGPLVVMGYGSFVERLLTRDLLASAPEFDFGKFTKYLERGVAPFVLNLILTIVLIPIVWGVLIAGMLAVAASQGEIWGVALGIAIVVIGMITIVALVGLVIVPLILRAMLLGSFGQVFDMRWSIDFIKRTWGPAMLSMIILPLIAIPMVLLGFLACYFGIFFAVVIILMIQWHIHVQLYHVYLDRGGTPLAIPDDSIPPAFPVGSPQHMPGPGGR